MGRQNTATGSVSTREKRAVSHRLLATYLRSATWSFAPNFWAMGMAKPLQTPMQKPSTIKLRDPVAPTPARGPMPRSLPTMMVSTTL